MSEVKHIQTEIDRTTHALLKNISRHSSKSLKEVVREAVADYVEKYESDIEKDTIFKIIGSFETKEENWSERDDWRC
ncbi:MAG: hypothetical protein KKI07_04040 [Euryarchaeota archaeon]|nr:hypothetical protein [Euryarchaeota archaeon]